MAVKLYEMKRLSSGMAAALAGVGRVEFLFELYRFGASVIDLTRAELDEDVTNASGRTSGRYRYDAADSACGGNRQSGCPARALREGAGARRLTSP